MHDQPIALLNLAHHDITVSQNSTNLFVKDVTCRGGNGIAFGSLGQYVQFVSRFAATSHFSHESLHY